MSPNQHPHSLRVGDSYDNAMAESLWPSLKRGPVHDTRLATKEQARLAIFQWIVWYSIERFHSPLDHMSLTDVTHRARGVIAASERRINSVRSRGEPRREGRRKCRQT